MVIAVVSFVLYSGGVDLSRLTSMLAWARVPGGVIQSTVIGQAFLARITASFTWSSRLIALEFCCYSPVRHCTLQFMHVHDILIDDFEFAVLYFNATKHK